jgi:hypothetical protein
MVLIGMRDHLARQVHGHALDGKRQHTAATIATTT